MKILPALLALVTVVGTALAASAVSSIRSSRVDEKLEVRLGYFANVTHATAIVGVEGGHVAAARGETATLETFTFNAGPAAVETLLSGALDATYIGPNPAINA